VQFERRTEASASARLLRPDSCASSEGLDGPRKGIKGAMSTRRDSTTDKRQNEEPRAIENSAGAIHRENHWRERVALRELAERESEFRRDWLGMLAIPDLRREYRRWEIDPRPKNGERKDAATRSRSSALQKASGTGGVGEHACNSTP